MQSTLGSLGIGREGGFYCNYSRSPLRARVHQLSQLGQGTQYRYQDSRLLAPVACFTKLVETGLWAIWVRGQCTVHSISAQTSQEAIKCTKQRSYQRWLEKTIYKMEMKFWAVLGRRGCREKNPPNCHKYATFWGVFFNFLWAKKIFRIFQKILKSYIITLL